MTRDELVRLLTVAVDAGIATSGTDVEIDRHQTASVVARISGVSMDSFSDELVYALGAARLASSRTIIE